jgi:hypothetical protein
MSYSNDITLGTVVYSLRSQRTNSTVRSDATQATTEPSLLTISHEIAKNGRVSSAVIFDDTKVVTSSETTPVVSTDKAVFKFQFNPLDGRTDHSTVFNALCDQLVAFLSVQDNRDKLINQEH